MKRLVVVLQERLSHLAVDGSSRCLCGAPVVDAPTVPLEPGADFGEHPKDCNRCRLARG